jgi:hypothetical protein
MHLSLAKGKEGNQLPAAKSVAQEHTPGYQASGFKDQRRQAVTQRKFQALADNFTAGKRATAQKPSNTTIPAAPIQLFTSESLEGELDEVGYQYRATSESRGANSFGGDNLARAVIVLENGEEVQLFAYSSFATSHGEEKLIASITEKYGKETLLRDPNTAGERHIKEIYTERAPCDSKNAESSRRERAATERNCNAYLSKVIHKNIPVRHSVPNNGSSHNKLMNKARLRYANEIVDDRRRMTYQNATNRSASYLAQFRKICFDKHRAYGRNYFSECQLVTQYIQQFAAAAIALDLNVDYRAPLVHAFESVPHYNGHDDESNLVVGAIKKTASEIEAQIDAQISALADLPDELMEAPNVDPPAKPPRRFRPNRELLERAGVRRFPGIKKKKKKKIDSEIAARMKKDRDLARRIRGDRT